MGDSEAVRQVRVHGVAGTPPHRILATRPRPVPTEHPDDSEPRSKVFRAHDPVPEGFSALEAFQWAPFTSGNTQQAINVLFAPFLFVNVAGWMQRRRGPLRSGMVDAALRAAAMATTSFLVIGLTWAFYLVPVQACDQLHRGDAGLGDLRCRFFDGAGWIEAPGLVLSVITGAGLAGWQWYKTRDRRVAADAATDELDWVARIDAVESSPRLSMLQMLHLALAITVVASIWVVAEAALAEPADRDAWNVGVVVVFAIVALLISLSCVIDVSRGMPDDGSVGRRRAGQAISALIMIAGCVGTFLALDPRVPDRTDFEQSLLAQFDVVSVLVAPGVIALVILGIVIGVDWWIENRSAAAQGFQALAILALSMLAGGALAAGLAFVALEFLGIGAIRSVAGANEHVALALPTTLLLFATLGGLVVLGVLRKTPPGVEAPMRAVTSATRSSLGTLLVLLGVCQAVAWPFALLWRPKQVPASVVIGVVAFLAFKATAVLLVILSAGRQPSPWRVRTLAVAAVPLLVAALTVISMLKSSPERVLDWVTLGMPLLLLIWLVVRGLTDIESRRGLAVLSDLAGFWPRSFHPLLPRPYASRAIDALASYLAEGSGTVVFAGHSQGSLLSLLAVHRLREHRIDHGPLALITYGTPFAKMYRDGFPGEFSIDNSNDLVRSVSAEVDQRWINLYRDTDPIGGPVCGAPSNTYVRDVGEIPTTNVSAARSKNKVNAHSHYETTDEFETAAKTLRDQVRDAAALD